MHAVWGQWGHQRSTYGLLTASGGGVTTTTISHLSGVLSLSPFQRTLSTCVYFSSITLLTSSPALLTHNEILEMNVNEILGIPEPLKSNSKEEKKKQAVSLAVNL